MELFGAGEAAPAHGTTKLLSSAGNSTRGVLGLMRRSPSLVVFAANIGYVHPCVAHLVNRAIAISAPLIRVGIPFVGRGVVIPGGNVNDRTLRKHRRRIVGVDVI